MHTGYGNTIPLSSPEEIREKVWGMVTDPARIHPRDPGHPELCPINAYHLALEEGTGKVVAEACRWGEIPCVEHKRRGWPLS